MYAHFTDLLMEDYRLAEVPKEIMCVSKVTASSTLCRTITNLLHQTKVFSAKRQNFINILKIRSPIWTAPRTQVHIIWRGCMQYVPMLVSLKIKQTI